MSKLNTYMCLFYVDTTVTNKSQTKLPSIRKLTVENDPLDCCQKLLMNTMVVTNHIFQASKIKLQKEVYRVYVIASQ